MNKLPRARSTGIVVQTLDNETLIYDLKTHKALTLNETSSVVYRACDGITTFDELKNKFSLTDEIIFLALAELHKENLLEENESLNFSFTGVNRREMIRKAATASIVALPLISALVAPTAAMAQSSCSAPANRANGCPVGTNITVLATTCAGFSDANKNSVCNAYYGRGCSSTNAAYAGDCVQAGTNIQYTCVCAP